MLSLRPRPARRTMDAVDHPRTVTIVAFDGLQLLDLAGPVEVLAAANALVRRDLYDVQVATPGGQAVHSTSGIEVGAHLDLADAPARAHRARHHTVLIVGGTGTRRVMHEEVFLEQVRAVAERSDLVTSVCTGSLVLAAAGLLDGHRATTHWAFCDLLDRFPDVDVLPDQIHVRDRDRWTSAGVTAGIDLALAMVDEDHGPELAHLIAAELVVFARRPGGQAQFSAALRAQAARTPAVAEVQRWLPDNLHEDLSVARLAERAAMSQRSFARTFRAETGTTPAAHVEALRVEGARRRRETPHAPGAALAPTGGVTHAETRHRAGTRRGGTTPARYRQHFALRSA